MYYSNNKWGNWGSAVKGIQYLESHKQDTHNWATNSHTTAVGIQAILKPKFKRVCLPTHLECGVHTQTHAHLLWPPYAGPWPFRALFLMHFHETYHSTQLVWNCKHRPVCARTRKHTLKQEQASFTALLPFLLWAVLSGAVCLCFHWRHAQPVQEGKKCSNAQWTPTFPLQLCASLLFLRARCLHTQFQTASPSCGNCQV